jgi:hypothetical protein
MPLHRRPGKAALALALFLALHPLQRLQACSVCGCGDPLLAAGSAMPMAGQMRFSLDGEYLYATAAGADPGTTEFLAQQTLRPVLVYSPGASLSLVLQVPLVRKNWWTNDPLEPLLATDNRGLGDVDLGGRWFFWQDLHVAQRWNQNLALSAGASLPTGDSNITVRGQLIDQHAQLGTGAAGPYAGLLYGYNGDPWGAALNATYRYRGTNSQGYQFGQALSFGLGGHLRILRDFSVTLNLDGRYADYDHDWAAGGPNTDTGGTVLDLTPGFGWQLGDGVGLTGRVQAPIYTRLFGTQSVSPTYDVSVQYLFSR